MFQKFAYINFLYMAEPNPQRFIVAYAGGNIRNIPRRQILPRATYPPQVLLNLVNTTNTSVVVRWYRKVSSWVMKS